MLAYECLSVEGGLFPAEWFGKLAQSALPEMDAEHYRLPAGLQLRDEISRAWTISRTWWQRYAKVRDDRVAVGSQAVKAATSFIASWLREGMGFESLALASPAVVHGRTFQLTLTGLEGRVPILVAGWDESLDTPLDRLKDGRRRSPFGLMQEYLNAADLPLWGIVSNGRTLRLLRDNAALTRPTWVEVDLERLFAGESHADFAALWLLLHETRFGLPDAAPDDSWIERQRLAAMQDGTRAREKLSAGVTQALRDLGEGFLHQTENLQLREDLRTGTLTEPAYFAQLLRLIYRLIFVVTVEERGLLHPSGTEGSLARARYRDGYSILGLRDRAARTVHEDGHHDLWLRLQCVFDGLAIGQAALALPAFGGLFARTQCPALDSSLVTNAHLLRALRALTWVPAGRGLARVNWRDMGSEEFGSVYESLLELVPQVRLGDPHPFRFLGEDAEGTEGNARKLSGSYYTPDSLVQSLLNSTLESMIAQRIASQGDESAAADALLSFKVIDPACGSGHFLLGASRRLAGHLAQLRTDGTPSAAEYRIALRQVVTHCIYGTDKNALAIELARMALWLEAASPDAPLGFLDHHLRHGDALLGIIDLSVLTDGIPDDAYDPLTGDDRATAQALKRRNRQERGSLENQRSGGPQFALLPAEPLDTEAFILLEGMPDDTPLRLEEKKARAEMLTRASAEKGVSLAANLYAAAFLIRKQGSGEVVPTTRDVIAALQGQKVPDAIKRAATEIANAEPFTHWKLQFPQVYAGGGFDVVIGNPPWEQLEFSEEEFFASREPQIARLAGHARKSAIDALSAENPRLHAELVTAQHRHAAVASFTRGSGRYPLTARGKLNFYPLFAETLLGLLDRRGRGGLIVPTGIATDDSTKTFFASISTNGRLISLYDFENREKLFAAVDSRMKFCLLTIGSADETEFVFFATNIRQLLDERRRFSLTAAEFQLLNPNTLTCPIFRSSHDAELTKAIYRRVQVLLDDSQPAETGNPWGISFAQGLFNMTSDSGLFTSDSAPDRIPLYEAKMMSLYDHRAGSYATRDEGRGYRVLPTTTDEQYADPAFVATPFYWVKKADVEGRMLATWRYKWLLAFADVTSATNARTLRATILPRYGVGNTAPILFPRESVLPIQIAALYANLCCITLDYVARQKVSGLHINFFIIKQLPVLPPDVYLPQDLSFIVPRVMELTYVAHDIEPFARDLGYPGPPFPFDKERRAILRAELDAWYAHLYGLSRDELRYVLDPEDLLGADYPSETFRVLKKNEVAEFGEFRTARLVLAAWDRLIAPARKARGLP
jgi:hypothetical protein